MDGVSRATVGSDGPLSREPPGGTLVSQPGDDIYRTAATALAVLLLAACSAGDDAAAPDVLDTVLATVDVDAAVGSDVVFYDLAPNPDGAPVALVGAAGADQSWLVSLKGTAPSVRTVAAVEPGC